ncbi:MAG TPA: 50S ribosomal protein L4 [Acidimicrobiia bacterium]|nr:50S ribosomal protein L4 [Acidimicrobiia bacterium]
MPEKLTAELYDASGARKGEVELSPVIFGIEPNVPVMHQVVTAQLAAARSGTASTKTRSEVRGGGRKPWRQKGLGRARHGSIRSPQWIGGGVAHGPKPRDYSQRTPKKMRRLALRSALSTRAAAGQIKVVDSFDDWAAPKTKQAVALLDAMGVSGKVLLIAEDHERTAIKSFRNLGHVIASNLGQANTYDVLWADTVVMSKGTLDLGQAAPRGTEEHAEGVRGPADKATSAGPQAEAVAEHVAVAAEAPAVESAGGPETESAEGGDAT